MTHNLTKTCAMASGLLAVCVALMAPYAAASDASAADGLISNAPGAMFAFRDPETGQMRHHTSAELEALRATLEAWFNDSTEGLEEVRLPDGSVMVDLEGRILHSTVATVAPDGSVRVLCLADPDRIVELAASVVPVPPAADNANQPAVD